MSRQYTVFACQKCGYQSPKWLGRCPDCSNWNTLVEEMQSPQEAPAMNAVFAEAPKKLCEIEAAGEIRDEIGIGELDRLLGGGIVKGSIVLVGGEPGIGKSTLLLQLSNKLSANGDTVLYVSGEESVGQTKLRAERLGKASESLYIVSQTDLDTIEGYIDKLYPKAVVIDSVQTISRSGLSSSPGSVGQVRECASRLTQLGKSKGISIFLIGHVTKDGSIAGPRVLEHMVDVVLYFEGERHAAFKILRAVKNRFGSTNEVGIFRMTSNGLEEVENPSELFLSERPKDTSGSVVVPVLEGTRPLLVEIQALVTSSGFGVPMRRAIGVDFNRLSLLVAVLERRIGLGLYTQDIFVSAVGGVKVDEPAADLGIVMAIASSFKDKPVDTGCCILGEVGLTGEVRGVTQTELRVKEAGRLGFKRCIVSKPDAKSIRIKSGMEIIGAASVREALDIVIS
ncbi:MAG: DNA repair protein RadA [Candidatus Omnitrophica bacterium CG1_02_49_10]|nr:MAG: DNA repair protein RadA [Candidatus Omnitrophica bacterium CG1_02_49_10]